MRRLIAAILATAIGLPAWNNTGHMAAAAIAYKRLKENTRRRADALLVRHPDYSTVLTRGAPTEPENRALFVFMVAATWPDIIKNDPRFWDDTRPGASPTNTPGFPDSKQHRNWHYKDIAFSPDGTPAPDQPPPNALTELLRISKALSKPPGDPANPSYVLPWFLHIASDVHQPLHCISRFTKALPQGDAGGNGVWVEPGIRLHALWDGAPGRLESFSDLVRLADDIIREFPEPGRIDSNFEKWIEEGAEIARREVYTFGNENGSRESPVRLTDDYRRQAQKRSRAQIALAGLRIAKILNDRLK